MKILREEKAMEGEFKKVFKKQFMLIWPLCLIHPRIWGWATTRLSTQPFFKDQPTLASRTYGLQRIHHGPDKVARLDGARTDCFRAAFTKEACHGCLIGEAELALVLKQQEEEIPVRRKGIYSREWPEVAFLPRVDWQFLIECVHPLLFWNATWHWLRANSGPNSFRFKQDPQKDYLWWTLLQGQASLPTAF